MGRIRLISMAAVLLAGVLVWNMPGFADSYVGGRITGDTVWDKAGSPYMLTEDLTIDQGATLTIQPGVVVYGNDEMYKSYGIFVEGALTAEGTEEERIKFDRGPGWQWLGIRFYDSSDDNKCILLFCDVVNTNSAIICKDSAPTISHCLIESEGGAIDLYGNPDLAPKILHNIIRNSASGIFTLGPSPLIKGNIITGNRVGIVCTKSSHPKIILNDLYDIVCNTSTQIINARENFWSESALERTQKHELKTGRRIDYSNPLSVPQGEKLLEKKR